MMEMKYFCGGRWCSMYRGIVSTLDERFGGIRIAQQDRLGSLHASALGAEQCQLIAFSPAPDLLLHS